MPKTFTCCELIKRIREHQEAPTNNWLERDKYVANEFIWKSSWKIINKRIKKMVNSEPVWTSDTDYLFCDECNKWFEKQIDLQSKLIKAEIEKEKAEGKYYGPRNPKTYEGTIMEDTIKKMREGDNQNNFLPFGKSPQE